MRRRSDDGKILKRLKVKILGFYPNFVLTERNGFKECFTYWDFEQLTAVKKGEAA
jgi:3-methyladenine DNA glycosylase Tag